MSKSMELSLGRRYLLNFFILLIYLLGVIIILYIIALAALAIIKLLVAFGLYDLATAEKTFGTIVGLDAYSLIKTVFVLLIGLLIVGIFKDESGIIITPFEVGASGVDYNGKALSDLLVTEMQRIYLIHNIKHEMIRPIESEKIQALGNESENLSYNISGLGTVNLGSISISLGQLLIAFKRLCFGSDPGRIINGSIQKYGTMICLVAHMDDKEIRTWEVKQEIKYRVGSGDEQIPDMVRNLAFMIAKDISPEKDIQAKTWLGLKYFTEALDAHRQYNLTGENRELERSFENCLKATDIERSYEKPLVLLFNVGLDYLDKNDYMVAERLFQKLNALKTDSGVLCCLGILHEHFNRHEDAVKAYKKASEQNPKDAKDWSNKGIALHELGKQDDAIKAYDSAIELDPKFAHAWSNKGNIFIEQGKYEDALECYDRAIENKSRFSNAWNGKGNALTNLNKYDEAIKAYDSAIEVDPKFAHAWSNKGNIFIEQGKYEDALECYDRAIGIDPKNTCAWNGKGLVLINCERYNESIRFFEEIIEINPKDAAAWNNKSWALYKLGRYNESIESVDESLKIDPHCASSLDTKGVALSGIGNCIEAIKCFDEALKLNPKETNILTHKGDTLYKMGNFSAAIECYNGDIVLNSKLTAPWLGKGNAFCDQGKYDDAIIAYNEAIKINPQYAVAWYMKGNALKSLGRTTEANAAHAKARELGYTG